MEDTFLKEQLQRIRRLSAHISEACDRLGGQLPGTGEATVHAGPLQVRDYRPYQTQNYDEVDERHPSVERDRKPRHTETPRRRRRG